MKTNVNIDCCFFVLTNVKSENKRKNDTKELKILVRQDNSLLSTPFDESTNIKDSIRNKISATIGSDKFHLEQVYTLGDKRFYAAGISIIYLGITNEENIKDLDSDYKLLDFDIEANKKLVIGDTTLFYETKTNKVNNSLEYVHSIKTDDPNLERIAIELLTSYKQITMKLDYTDIMFQFLPKYYTLEDVRIVYEKIKNKTVDKSNFRKKIMRYCKATDKIISNKGYRPTQLYEFVLDENDIWL